MAQGWLLKYTAPRLAFLGLEHRQGLDDEGVKQLAQECAQLVREVGRFTLWRQVCFMHLSPSTRVPKYFWPYGIPWQHLWHIVLSSLLAMISGLACALQAKCNPNELLRYFETAQIDRAIQDGLVAWVNCYESCPA